MKRIALALLLLAPAAEAAPTLSLPSAERTAGDQSRMGSYALPVGPWMDGRIDTIRAEGEVAQLGLAGPRPRRPRGWASSRHCATSSAARVSRSSSNATPTAAAASTSASPRPPCPTWECMSDLGDFRFLSARRTTGGAPDYVSLLVSRSSDSGYVQMTRVGAALMQPLPIAAAEFSPREAEPSPNSLGDQLIASGKVVLGDLRFTSGSADLAGESFPSLDALADFLRENPDKTIALVGHTDAEGSLAANIAVSRKRAQSVADRLVSLYGVDSAQLTADGVGYLSPLASNLTPEGRSLNRRVEAMIT